MAPDNKSKSNDALFRKSDKKLISGKVEWALTFFQRMRGLMFRRKTRHALIFVLDCEARLDAAIHMFFVFFSIDVVFMDSGWKIVDIKRNIKPFTPMVVPEKAAKYIVELPAGMAKNLKINDVLETQAQ